MQLRRTRFKQEIVAEFLPPSRKNSRKVVIFCSGMPGVPSKRSLMEFLAKEGFWVFFPRYRGSWESSGRFLKKSPEQDIVDVIDALPRGFKDLGNRAEFRIQPTRLFLIGSSFGGPAAILASRDRRVDKAVAISPVVDWRAPSRAEPLTWLRDFTRNAFGEGYRFSAREWRKLSSGRFYNPATHTSDIDGSKLFIIHARDDDVVKYQPVERFARKVGAKFKLYKRGGHLGASVLMRPSLWRQVKRFLQYGPQEG